MLPPSATLGVAVRVTVLVSVVSLTAVTAGAGLMARFSKLPPLALVMVTEVLPASTYTSSAGAGTVTVPVLAPAAMVMVALFDSVTVTSVCAGEVRLAV